MVHGCIPVDPCVKPNISSANCACIPVDSRVSVGACGCVRVRAGVVRAGACVRSSGTENTSFSLFLLTDRVLFCGFFGAFVFWLRQGILGTPLLQKLFRSQAVRGMKRCCLLYSYII